MLNSKALYAFPDRAITERARARARCSLFVHAEWQIFVHLPLPRFMLVPLAKSRGITRALLLAFSIAFYSAVLPYLQSQPQYLWCWYLLLEPTYEQACKMKALVGERGLTFKIG